MARPSRDRLSVAQAAALFGRSRLRALASSRQTFNNWEHRGVPWESIGPVLLEWLSQSSAPHSIRAEGAMAHIVVETQGRVWLLAREYGTESKEFRALVSLLSVYLTPPEKSRKAPMAKRPKTGGG